MRKQLITCPFHPSDLDYNHFLSRRIFLHFSHHPHPASSPPHLTKVPGLHHLILLIISSLSVISRFEPNITGTVWSSSEQSRGESQPLFIKTSKFSLSPLPLFFRCQIMFPLYLCTWILDLRTRSCICRH